MSCELPIPAPRLQICAAARDLFLLIVVALLLAGLSACPYAGSWNDGSRLATVESLLDRQTVQIDDSIFCHPPRDLIERGHAPYPIADTLLLQYGTCDKLQINGHYYSDKPLVISFLMAGVYRLGMFVGLPAPGERPDVFCWWMTFLCCGGAYAVTLCCLDRLCRAWDLLPRTRWLLVTGLGLGTFALTYTQHVNNHILLLAVFSLILLLANQLRADSVSLPRLAALGTLGGLAFNLDLGSGPLLAVGLGLFTLWQYRRVAPALWLLLWLAPWVVAWEGLNYAIAGVWVPMNMVPEYSQWPGCPFHPGNMTGFVHHGPCQKCVYALGLLFGKVGFFCHNLPLLLAIPAGWQVLRRPSPQRPLLVFAIGWCVATWLQYALLSNNWGGGCCSIRWFVPFLTAGFLLLALHLKSASEYEADFLVLGGWGLVLAARMWWQGPFTLRMILWLWPVVGCALLHWLLIVRRRSVRRAALPTSHSVVRVSRRAA